MVFISLFMLFLSDIAHFTLFTIYLFIDNINTILFCPEAIMLLLFSRLCNPRCRICLWPLLLPSRRPGWIEPRVPMTYFLLSVVTAIIIRAPYCLSKVWLGLSDVKIHFCCPSCWYWRWLKSSSLPLKKQGPMIKGIFKISRCLKVLTESFVIPSSKVVTLKICTLQTPYLQLNS